MEAVLKQDAEDFLAGTVAGVMAGYELRQPQLVMIRACAGVMEEGGTLIAEAGTGTGKTFAYLIPAILSGKKTIVSTRTINLQEQLVTKDLSFLSSLHGFQYAIAKGRGHYICLRRLHAFRPDDNEELAERKDLLEWIEETETGDIEDYNLQGRPFIWGRVCSDADACKGKKCPYVKDCCYFAARNKWESAQVIVTNHALLTVNATMAYDKKILPVADVLVVDEGHSLDSIISEQIGLNLSDRGLENILNTLLKVDQRGGYKGLLSKSPFLFPAVEALKAEISLFWIQAKDVLANRKIIRGAFALADNLSVLSNSIKAFLEEIKATPLGLFTEDEELDLKSAMSKLRSIADGMEMLLEETGGFVRWSEVEEKRTALRMAPIYPSEFVRNNIVPDFSSIILTSATLSASGDFRLIRNILGLEQSATLSVPAPFDIKSQVDVVVKRGIDLQQNAGKVLLAEVIIQESSEGGGGTLVLFTSREVMKKTWELSFEDLALAGLNPMVQGELSNRRMLDVMRSSKNAVIFGLDSFWEGVDVKGDALNRLIITKLPFEVPSEPIVLARTEEISKRGGNPFRDYSLPRAVLKFKQGFGRLIRSKNDRGRVIICDDRIETKEYGHRFLESIFGQDS